MNFGADMGPPVGKAVSQMHGVSFCMGELLGKAVSQMYGGSFRMGKHVWKNVPDVWGGPFGWEALSGNGRPRCTGVQLCYPFLYKSPIPL